MTDGLQHGSWAACVDHVRFSINLERLFNVRDGLDRKEDTLPKRLLEEAMPSGPSQGNTVPLDQMLGEYYDLMGWDSNGVPLRDRMEELGLQEEWEAAQRAMG